MSERPRVCFWCGGDAPTSKDHVFPRNLFPEPMPPDVSPITVPACDRHNGAFSQDEEYFRDFVVGASYSHPDAREIWDAKSVRAFQRSPKYRDMLARDLHDVDYTTRGGIFLGKVSVMTAQAERIQVVLRKIVTGLYYRDFETTLGFPAMRFGQLLSTEDFEPFRPVAATMQKRELGPITFAFDRASDAPRGVVAILFFYGLICFVVISDPREPDVEDPLDAPPKEPPKLWTPPEDR
jgi:hypothetical protein